MPAFTPRGCGLQLFLYHVTAILKNLALSDRQSLLPESHR